MRRRNNVDRSRSWHPLMLAARARRGAATLEAPWRAKIAAFVASRHAPEGGLCGRDDRPDLYYSAFGAAIAHALGAPIPAHNLNAFARTHDPAKLDLPHLLAWHLCLAHPPRSDSRALESFRDMLERFRTHAGGYALSADDQPSGSPYACLLGYLALSVAHPRLTSPWDAAWLWRHWPDWRSRGASDTTTVAAAACLLFAASKAEEPAAARATLLASAHASGGFAGGAKSPSPDMLSTAAALAALVACAPEAIRPLRDSCIDFIEDAFHPEPGGFGRDAIDPQPDLEYTYYALLALGLLS